MINEPWYQTSVGGYGRSAVSVLESGIVTGDFFGIQMFGTNNSVTIAGQVSGDTGVSTGSFNGVGGSTVSVLDGGIVSGYYGVYMLGSYNTVLNDGTISGTYAISITGNQSNIVNTGSILGDVMAVILTTTGFTTWLVNQGDISSTNQAIFSSGWAADTVVNQGTITGLIGLGDGNDRIVNNGTIVGSPFGAVNLGEGADTYDGRLGTIDGNVLGGTGYDRLLGGVGAETLDGGIGYDTLKGYGGDDSYLVDSFYDFVSEVGGTGDDTIITTVSLDLTATNLRGDIENVTLAGVGNLNAYGDGLDNELTGNEAANLLDGRAGADHLAGRAGDDIYVVDNILDVVEDSAGTDTVRSSVSFNLEESTIEEPTQVLGEVENIELTGSAAVSASGSFFNNLITGNVAANLLTGDWGADTFRFVTALTTTNADTITDFDAKADSIHLDNAVMAALGLATGPLAAGQFWASLAGVAHDADDRVIYDIDGGILWYDADGNGAGAALRLANLTPNLALTSADFTII